MKNNSRFHSNAPSNPNALYPRAVNSPLRYKQIVADDDESEACDESDARVKTQMQKDLSLDTED